jgi:hypothetical protein
MPGQTAQYGSMALANQLCGSATPVISSTAPAWIPGMVWINTTSTPTLNYWNGTEWVAGSPALYLALLISDPTSSGASGVQAVNISDLGEDPTTGYARQAITFGLASASLPARATNTSIATFGPYDADQQTLVQWAALVTAESGTAGILRDLWTLDTPQQVASGGSIVFPPGTLSVSEGS